MLKRILLAALWLPLVAFAQSYPSPTFNNVTVNGTLSAAGGVTLSGLTANTFVYSGAGGLLASTTAPTNGQLLIGSTGVAPVKATLTGTTNQINVTNGAGSITLSTPQNIDSTATPTFFGVTLNGSTAHGLIVGGGNGVPATYTGAGTSAQVLTSNGSSADPTFQAIPWGTPGAIGATTPNSGAFTTLSASSTFTPSQTAGIVGTTTNNNANAGSVGEYVCAQVTNGGSPTGCGSNSGTAISLTTATPSNVTSLSLTAGDWNVWGTICFAPAGTTVVASIAAQITTTSATLGTPPNFGAEVFNSVSSTGAAVCWPVGVTRELLSATTTVYLVTQSSFSTSTNAAYGFLAARRMR